MRAGLEHELAHEHGAMQERQPLHVDPDAIRDDRRRATRRRIHRFRCLHGHVAQRDDGVDRREAHVADVDARPEHARQPGREHRREDDRECEPEDDEREPESDPHPPA